jgi:hypothetical protein
MDGVQSFGEKRVFRRTIGRLCRSGVRSLKDKSPLLLGLSVREFTQRIRGLGQSGGARGIRTVGAIYLCLTAPPITIGSLHRSHPAGFTLRLSSWRFHDASTNDISGFNSGSKKPSKTMRFQGLVDWLRGLATTDTDIL